MISEVSYPNENEIKTRAIIAICRLYCHDQDLLDVGVNERSLTHKLAEYLQDEFPEWHVDCEYNRRHDQVKKLRIREWHSSPDDTEARTVVPDIIVHRRQTDQNLIVLESRKPVELERITISKSSALLPATLNTGTTWDCFCELEQFLI